LTSASAHSHFTGGLIRILPSHGLHIDLVCFTASDLSVNDTNLFHATLLQLHSKRETIPVLLFVLTENSGSNAYRRIQGWGSHRSLHTQLYFTKLAATPTTHFSRYEKLIRFGDLSWRTFVLSPTRTNYVQVSYQILPADSQIQARKKTFTDQPRHDRHHNYVFRVLHYSALAHCPECPAGQLVMLQYHFFNFDTISIQYW